MQPIEKSLWTIFTAIGFITILTLVALFAYFALDALRNVVQRWRWRYEYKHRFDKPPTAKCYCKDCVYHGNNGNDYSERCSLNGVERFTPFNGFCYEAEPINAKEGERRAKQ